MQFKGAIIRNIISTSIELLSWSQIPALSVKHGRAIAKAGEITPFLELTVNDKRQNIQNIGQRLKCKIRRGILDSEVQQPQ